MCGVRFSAASVLILLLTAASASAQPFALFSDWSPEINAKAGAIYLARQNPSGPVLWNATPGGAPLFNANAFDFSYEFGYDIQLGLGLGELWEIDARHFAVDGWQATSIFTVGPGATSGLNTTPNTAFIAPTGSTCAQRYQSQLHSSEVNLRRDFFDIVEMLFGVRYVEYDEVYNMWGIDTAGPTLTIVTSDVRNRMYGLQTGADVNLWENDIFSLSTFAKAGGYLNVMDHQLAFRTNIPATVGLNNGNDTDLAFLGEVGIAGSIWLTENIAVHASYQLTWLEGVTLAVDQIPNSPPLALGPPATTNIDQSGLLFNGGNIMFEVRLP